MALTPTLGISRGSYDPSYADEPAGDIAAGLYPPTSRRSPMPTPPVGYDDVTKQVFVNGMTFHADDHGKAVESEEFLRSSPAPVQMPENYRPMGPEEYRKYISDIKDPSLGRLAKKNFGIGVDVSQMLAGSALKFAGAEETGQAIMDQQAQDLSYNDPYQRAFTDIDSASGAGEWFVANAAQMAPLMAEMAITSFIGAGIGGAVAGGSALAKGGIGLLARSGKLKTAARARMALKKLRSGTPRADLSAAEATALKTVGRANGARFGAAAASYGVAVGDIYSEVEESGNYDSPALARLATALFAVPYAAAEVMPATLAATTAFRAAGQGLKKGGRLRRGATGATVGAGIEGGTEVLQDMISLGASGQLDFDDPEVQNQLVNAFAAGAGIGAPIGGMANMLKRNRVDVSKENSDLLNPESDLDQIEAEERLQIEFQPRELEEGENLLAPPYSGGPDPLLLEHQEGSEVGTLEPLPPSVFEAAAAQQEADSVLDLTPEMALDPDAIAVSPETREQRGLEAQFAENALEIAAEEPQLELTPEMAQEAQFQQAEAAVSQQPPQVEEVPAGTQPDLGVLPQAPEGANFAARPLALRSPDGEPMIMQEQVVEETGETVQVPVPVREVLGNSFARLKSLTELNACLARGG